MLENPRGGRQARNFTTKVPKILDLKSSSEQIFSENSRWVPLFSLVLHQWNYMYVRKSVVNAVTSCVKILSIKKPCTFFLTLRRYSLKR